MGCADAADASDPLNGVLLSVRYLGESYGGIMIATYGRFQPPHKGHEHLIRSMQEIANELHTEAVVYISPSEGDARNPLSFEMRYELLKQICAPYDVTVSADRLNNRWVLQQLLIPNSTNVLMIGPERVALGDTITYRIPAVHRREWQGTHLRALARARRVKAFTALLPEVIQPQALEIMKAIRRGGRASPPHSAQAVLPNRRYS